MFLLNKFFVTNNNCSKHIIKNTHTFNNTYNESIYIYVPKKTTIFNKTIKNIKNKVYNGKIFNNATLTNVQKTFIYNIKVNRNPFYFLPNHNSAIINCREGKHHVNLHPKLWDIDNVINNVLNINFRAFISLTYFNYLNVYIILNKIKSFLSNLNVFSVNTNKHTNIKFNNVDLTIIKNLPFTDKMITLVYNKMCFSFYGLFKKLKCEVCN